MGEATEKRRGVCELTPEEEKTKAKLQKDTAPMPDTSM